MSFKIEKVAVLGAGVMGAQIAAHLTNAGIPVLLFDMNQEIVDKGFEFCKGLKPAPFYNPKNAELITPLNYEDHLEQLKECDWVVEVIAERLDWKRGLYDKIKPYIKDTAIISTNTSGINLSDLIEGMSTDFTSRFCVTHFFNPPRYLQLVEVVSGENTNPEVIDNISQFLENTLGKGVVHAKDTPNFIANRIGVFGMMTVLDVAKKLKMSVEDVDSLTGTLIGREKSATFRTADVVGLDTLSYVANTAYEKCVDDEAREIFVIPEYLQKIIDNGWLGQKSGQGFYKKVEKRVIHSLDLNTLEYTPQNKSRFKGVGLAREKVAMDKRLRALLWSPDVAGEFSWEVFSKTLLYSAHRMGEISDDIISIDNALKWGFAWGQGPFEIWDALGFNKTLERMKKDGKLIPTWVTEMAEKGFTAFYSIVDGVECVYCPNNNNYIPIKRSENELTFSMAKAKGGLIRKGWSASLVDLGDKVAAIELHSVLKPELNPIDGSLIEMIYFARHWVEENGYNGLVVSSSGPQFSAGANLNLILNAAKREKWAEIEKLTKSMQDVLQSLKYAPFPVIAAPYKLALGGGYEIIGACDKIVALGELYCGLVEVGVGLIPGAGGNLRVLSNLTKKFKSGFTANFQVVQKAFESIGMAKFSMSAKQAQSLGYLRKNDEIVLNQRHLLKRAKDVAIEMSDGYQPPEPETFRLPGLSGRLPIKASIKSFLKKGKISEHDAFIGEKLSYVLTGGDKGGPLSKVDEQYLLDIEREVFVSLCKEPKTLDRITHMLSKGKVLRN
ncbi:MAG: 3-hydroxyacyl-CoA dehydrogenase/enoyl-CoA hydratase family protein [Candidatus Marinimicrobia bacterium]|nr:3-hydroxyacyl-CoA dehydrogenase/enoyl-CoA hydratase family protein [Candidatus Neomarinimicrobiota bacterium]